MAQVLDFSVVLAEELAQSMSDPIWFATAHLQLTGNIPLLNPEPFAAEGFEVHAMCPGTGQPVVNALLQGRVEVCNVLALPLIRSVQGQGLKFVCSYQPTGWELWTSPSITSLKDLTGRCLAPTSPMARSYLDDGLRQAGGDPASVLEGAGIQLNGPGAEQLRRGTADPAILMSLVTAMAESLGLRQLAQLSEWGQPMAYGVMTTDHMLAERRNEVVRLVRALLASVRALKADRELALTLTRAQGLAEEFRCQDGGHYFAAAGYGGLSARGQPTAVDRHRRALSRDD